MKPSRPSSASDTPSRRYLEIYGAFKRRIEGGQLRPGDRLPTVCDIMRECSASRTTVARAFCELQRDGLVVSRRRGGTRVAESPTRTTEVIIPGRPPTPGSMTERYHRYLLTALHQGLTDTNRRVLLSYMDEVTPSWREMLNVAQARRTDSLIVYRPDARLAAELAEVADRIATVSLFHPVQASRADAVVSDPAPAVRAIVQRHLEMGRRDFAFVALVGRIEKEPESSPYCIMRRTLLETLAAARIAPTEIRHLSQDWSAPANREALEAFTRLPPYTVVFSVMAELPQVRCQEYFYTEMPETVERFGRRASVLYLRLERVARAAAELTLQRKESGLALDARSVRLTPEVVEVFGGEDDARGLSGSS